MKDHCGGSFDFTTLRSPVPAALAQAGQAPRRSNLVNLLSPRRDCFAALAMTTPHLRTGKVLGVWASGLLNLNLKSGLVCVTGSAFSRILPDNLPWVTTEKHLSNETRALAVTATSYAAIRCADLLACGVVQRTELIPGRRRNIVIRPVGVGVANDFGGRISYRF